MTISMSLSAAPCIHIVLSGDAWLKHVKSAYSDQSENWYQSSSPQLVPITTAKECSISDILSELKYKPSDA